MNNIHLYYATCFLLQVKLEKAKNTHEVCQGIKHYLVGKRVFVILCQMFRPVFISFHFGRLSVQSVFLYTLHKERKVYIRTQLSAIKINTS